MKAITLWQPWASLIAVGAKTIETRSWNTSYRGPLAIHAAKQIVMPNDLKFVQAVDALGLSYKGLPTGAVLGWCELTDCQEMTEASILGTDTLNRLFGAFRPGRYAWMLGPFHALESPVLCRGRQKLWDWVYTAPAVEG